MSVNGGNQITIVRWGKAIMTLLLVIKTENISFSSSMPIKERGYSNFARIGVNVGVGCIEHGKTNNGVLRQRWICKSCLA